MRSEAYFRLLTRGQIRLNMIFITVWILKLTSITAVSTGFLIIIFRLLGWPVSFFVWIIATLAGGFTGLVLGWQKKLTQFETAFWLDQYLQDSEALSAAVFCFERNCSGVPDQAVIERADNVAITTQHIHWPVRALNQWLGLALVTLVGVGLLVNYWFPTFQRNETQFLQSFQKNNLQQQPVEKPVPVQKQTPQEFGKVLFPQDEKLARQVEKALQDGDFKTLNTLFQQANINMEQKIAKSASASEINRLRNEQQKAREMMKQLPNNRDGKSQGDKNTAENKGKKSGTGNKKGRQGSGEEKSNADRSKQITQGKNGPQTGKLQHSGSGNPFPNNNPNSAKQPGNEKANSGKQAGKGTGKKNGDRGEIVAKFGKKQALIAPRDNSPALELVIPGKNARVPLSDILPDSQRAAEAALLKDGVPIEYEDFTGSYFRKLAESLASKEGQE